MKANRTTLFFDIGGVLLTNGWDTPTRKKAIAEFDLDPHQFEARHEMLKSAFETDRITIDTYIQKTVFHRERTFSPEDFKQFMFAQSETLGDTLDWVKSLAKTGSVPLYTLNNESRELHEYRAKKFGMNPIFRGFCASCYLGQTKPDEGMYRGSLGIAGCQADQATFIDDRELNVEAAQAYGFDAILFQNLEQLRKELGERGFQA